MASGKRLEGETMQHYRARLKATDIVSKRHIVCWNSTTGGTFNKAEVRKKLIKLRADAIKMKKRNGASNL